MALRMLRPTVNTLKPRLHLPPAEKVESDRLARRDRDVEWRKWYWSKEWQLLRRAAFIRDLYTCKYTGIALAGKHPEPNSPTAHHRIPHRGNRDLFFCLDNIETVSKAHHDSVLQAQEAEELRQQRRWPRPSG